MQLLYKEDVYEIINCAMEVLNELGHGFHEKIYENALCVEFNLRGIKFLQQKEFLINYKNKKVGISDHETGKMLNYLKVTKQKVGIIINFKYAKLEWKRVVL